METETKNKEVLEVENYNFSKKMDTSNIIPEVWHSIHH